jgi:transposase InsO family protein
MTGLSRASYYRWRRRPVESRVMEMRGDLHRLALEFPAYGYRPMTAALQRRGWNTNRKQVLHWMRTDNLLALRRKRFVITTDSRHGLRVYPNLAKDFPPTAANQLWVADITYIRLRTEFVYLAVILDAWSRKVVGWALGRTLETELTLAALRMALDARHPAPGLIHHSDRGVQYAAAAYVALLDEHQIRISMSRKANPYDNAKCESFMKTLKYEEVHRNEYQDFDEAYQGIGRFLEVVYNQRRLHSALGYRPPEEFEQQEDKPSQ